MADLAAAVEAPEAALVEPEAVVEAAVAVVAAPSGFAAAAVPAVFDSVLTAVVCAFAAVLCVFFAALEGTEAAAVLTTASDPDEIKAAVAFASAAVEGVLLSFDHLHTGRSDTAGSEIVILFAVEQPLALDGVAFCIDEIPLALLI